VSEEFMSVTT